MPDDAKGPAIPTKPLLSAVDSEPMPSTTPLGSNPKVTSLDARRTESNVTRLQGVHSPGGALAPSGGAGERGDAAGVVDSPAPDEASSDAASRRKLRELPSEEERAAVRAARRQQVLESFAHTSAPAEAPPAVAVPREQPAEVPPERPQRPVGPEALLGLAAADADVQADAGTHRSRRRPASRDVEPIKVNLPPLPLPARRRYGGTFLSFLLAVALPVCAAAVYYFFIASNQYVSEFKFAVRDAKTASQGSASSGGIGDIASLAGTGPNTLESYMVTEYLKSEAAIQELEKRINVLKMYSRPQIDWFGRFDPSKPIEVFTSYWNRRITTQFDQITGIGSARIRAYTPEDTYLIAKTLVAMSEELINELATRPQRDAVRSAEAEVKRAGDRLKGVTTRLAAYRNSEQVIEPTANVVTSNVQLATTLRAQLIQLQTELSSLKRQNLDAKAPMILTLQSRIKSVREQLAVVEGEVGNSREGGNTLSKVMGDYEQLDLERQFALASMNKALTTLDDARSQTVYQHMYVTPFVAPNLPQSSTYPQRLLFVGIALLACLLFWTAGLLFFRSVREHIV
jgi:capsular polysaccharide transport system permease protein